METTTAAADTAVVWVRIGKKSRRAGSCGADIIALTQYLHLNPDMSLEVVEKTNLYGSIPPACSLERASHSISRMFHRLYFPSAPET